MPADDDPIDIDLEDVRQDAALTGRNERVRELEEAGAVLDVEGKFYSLNGKTYDLDGNPLK
jgi:hypothetical protein